MDRKWKKSLTAEPVEQSLQIIMSFCHSLSENVLFPHVVFSAVSFIEQSAAEKSCGALDETKEEGERVIFK